MVAAALVGVAGATGLAAWWSMRLTLNAHRPTAAGIACVGITALAAFAGTLALDGPLAALTVPTASALAGFLVAIWTARADDDGFGRGSGDDEPPWWPSFERDLRDYEKQRIS